MVDIAKRYRATLHIDVLSQEAWEHIVKAEEHLAAAGFTCDRGIGCGGRDWELDWSLNGATLDSVREVDDDYFRNNLSASEAWEIDKPQGE